MAEWFADRITARLKPEPKGFSERAIQEMRLAPKIRFDQVMEFYFSGSAKEEWDIVRDFPFLIPPFDTVWLETRRPTTIVSEEHGVVDWGRLRPTAVAACIRRWDVRSDRRNNFAPEYAAAIPYFPAEAKHGLLVSVWLEFFGSVFHLDGNGSFGYVLDESGGVLYCPDVHGTQQLCFQSMPHSLLAKTKDYQGTAATSVAIGLQPALLALSFLNCKNTRIDETQPDRAQRRRDERAGHASSKYYVLTIDALRSEVTAKAGETGATLQKALHICRGHFATYSDEHPLFGKHTGRYWRQAHIRGNVDRGVVVKDYKIAV